MWRTNLQVLLPEGYEVKEDIDCFYLIETESGEILHLYGKGNSQGQSPAAEISRDAIRNHNIKD